MKDYRGEILSAINQFTGQANVLSVPRAFVKLLDGDMATAIFLSQCLYWSDRTTRKDGYFYKSMGEWKEEIALNEYYVRKATKKLKDELGLLDTTLKKAEGRPTVHYKINKERFNEWLIEGLTGDSESEGGPKEEKGEEKPEEQKEMKQKPNPFMFYEMNGFGTLSPYIVEQINYVIDNFGFDEPEEMIIGAMKIAVKNNARRWKYCETILMDWKKKGLKTLEQVKTDHKQRKTEGGAKNEGNKRSDESDRQKWGF